MVLQVMAYFAQTERESIRQRQAEGIAIAKKNRAYKGRQPIHYDEYLFQQLHKSWKEGDITQQYMCKKIGVSRTTLYRILKQHKVKS